MRIIFNKDDCQSKWAYFYLPFPFPRELRLIACCPPPNSRNKRFSAPFQLMSFWCSRNLFPLLPEELFQVSKTVVGLSGDTLGNLLRVPRRPLRSSPEKTHFGNSLRGPPKNPLRNSRKGLSLHRGNTKRTTRNTLRRPLTPWRRFDDLPGILC